MTREAQNMCLWVCVFMTVLRLLTYLQQHRRHQGCFHGVAELTSKHHCPVHYPAMQRDLHPSALFFHILLALSVFCFFLRFPLLWKASSLLLLCLSSHYCLVMALLCWMVGINVYHLLLFAIYESTTVLYFVCNYKLNEHVTSMVFILIAHCVREAEDIQNNSSVSISADQHLLGSKPKKCK